MTRWLCWRPPGTFARRRRPVLVPGTVSAADVPLLTVRSVHDR